MAYDTYLAERIRLSFSRLKAPYTEKEMMGGICFMVDDKMCIGIIKSDLMCRIGEKKQLEISHENHVKPMDFTGRPMRGYVLVEPAGFDSDNDLDKWIEACLAFNPEAKSSKQKKNKL